MLHRRLAALQSGRDLSTVRTTRNSNFSNCRPSAPPRIPIFLTFLNWDSWGWNLPSGATGGSVRRSPGSPQASSLAYISSLPYRPLRTSSSLGITAPRSPEATQGTVARRLPGTKPSSVFFGGVHLSWPYGAGIQYRLGRIRLQFVVGWDEFALKSPTIQSTASW